MAILLWAILGLQAEEFVNWVVFELESYIMWMVLRW